MPLLYMWVMRNQALLSIVLWRTFETNKDSFLSCDTIRMSCGTGKSVMTALTLLALVFGLINAAAALGETSTTGDSNAALLENMQRMQGYNIVIRENARAAQSQTSAAHTAGAVDEYEASQHAAPGGYASAQVVEALEVLIDSSNLSAEQRARLIRRLQEDNKCKPDRRQHKSGAVKGPKMLSAINSNSGGI